MNLLRSPIFDKDGVFRKEEKGFFGSRFALYVARMFLDFETKK